MVSYLCSVMIRIHVGLWVTRPERRGDMCSGRAGVMVLVLLGGPAGIDISSCSGGSPSGSVVSLGGQWCFCLSTQGVLVINSFGAVALSVTDASDFFDTCHHLPEPHSFWGPLSLYTCRWSRCPFLASTFVLFGQAELVLVL